MTAGVTTAPSVPAKGRTRAAMKTETMRLCRRAKCGRALVERAVGSREGKAEAATAYWQSHALSQKEKKAEGKKHMFVQ